METVKDNIVIFFGMVIIVSLYIFSSIFGFDNTRKLGEKILKKYEDK